MKSITLYKPIHQAIANYKHIMNLSTEALDGDEVDQLCKEIKKIINRSEGNIKINCICENCQNGGYHNANE